MVFYLYYNLSKKNLRRLHKGELNMGRKYLEDIGIKLEDMPLGFCLEEANNIEKGRGKRWYLEREKYGFDSRETWDLDYTLKLYLYERLCMYKEKLVFVKEELLKIKDIEYKGKIYTHKEVIDKVLDGFKLALTKDDLRFEKVNDKDIYIQIHDAFCLMCLAIKDIEYIGVQIGLVSKSIDINLEEESKVYGFNQRDVWFLVKNFKEYLYTRLKMYDEVTDNIIDKSAKFHNIEYNGEILTLQEYIDKILEGLELDIKCSDVKKINSKEIQEKIDVVFDLLPYGIKHLWW